MLHRTAHHRVRRRFTDPCHRAALPHRLETQPISHAAENRHHPAESSRPKGVADADPLPVAARVSFQPTPPRLSLPESLGVSLSDALGDAPTPCRINDLTPNPTVNHGCATVNHCGGWRWSMPMVYDGAVTAHQRCGLGGPWS